MMCHEKERWAALEGRIESQFYEGGDNARPALAAEGTGPNSASDENRFRPALPPATSGGPAIPLAARDWYGKEKAGAGAVRGGVRGVRVRSSAKPQRTGARFPSSRTKESVDDVECVHGLRNALFACRPSCVLYALREVPRSATSLRAATDAGFGELLMALLAPPPIRRVVALATTTASNGAPAPVADYAAPSRSSSPPGAAPRCLAGDHRLDVRQAYPRRHPVMGLGVDAPSEIPDRAAANSPWSDSWNASTNTWPTPASPRVGSAMNSSAGDTSASTDRPCATSGTRVDPEKQEVAVDGQAVRRRALCLLARQQAARYLVPTTIRPTAPAIDLVPHVRQPRLHGRPTRRRQ